MLVGTEDARLVLQQACRLTACPQRARLLVYRAQVALGAVGTDEPLDEALAHVLAQVDALPVEPVLTVLAANHPSMVVGSATEAVRPVVGLVVIVLARSGVCALRRGLGLLGPLPRFAVPGALGRFLNSGSGAFLLGMSHGRRWL